MNKQDLESLINSGREIEFTYKQKKYSITYYNDNREKYISFCEYYKDPTDVKSVNELCEIKIDGISLLEVLSLITNDNVIIF